MNKDKITKMEEQLLDKIQKEMTESAKVSISDVELLRQLEDMYRFRLKYEINK